MRHHQTAEPMRTRRASSRPRRGCFARKVLPASSVAELMHAAGLTHGGFYNHFGSKDDLEAAACAHVFEPIGRGDRGDRRDRRSGEARRQAFEDYRARAMSRSKARDAYGDRAARWWPSPATSRARPQPSARNMRRVCADISRRSSGRAPATARSARRRKRRARDAIAQFAALAGALTLARSVAEADPALSDEILEAAVAAL